MKARVQLGDLAPGDVQVEVYYGPMDTGGELNDDAQTASMVCGGGEEGSQEYLYRADISFRTTGKLGFAVRILPQHGLLEHPMDLGLVAWG